MRVEHFNHWQVPVQQYVQKGYWHTKTLGQELKDWAKRYGEAVAIVDGNNRLTYRDLDTAADALASGFSLLGVCRGDRVLLQLPNKAEFVVSIFALFRLGAIPVLTMPASREADIDALCAHAKPVAYITTSTHLGFDYGPMQQRIGRKYPFIKHLISDDSRTPGTLALSDIRGTQPTDLDEPEYQDTALLLISGGTTGTPKLIPRRHTDYAYVARATAERCGMNRNSVYLAVLPAAHNFTLCCPGILGALSSGGRVVMCQSTSCDEAFALIEREKVTHTALVPSLLNLWLDAREWEQADLSSLQLLQIGGAPLDPSVAARVTPVLGCRLQQVFGTAEGLICVTSPDDPPDVILNTQGRPVCADDELRIVDANDNDVPPGEEGELLVRGPYTIGGYYEAPEANSRAITRDGYYRTGDIARITPQGNLQIRGRIKDQINRNGEKIAAVEVENHLRAHPLVQDAAVVGTPDADLGERLCAWIIPANGQQLTLVQLYGFLEANGVPRHKFPDQLEHIEAWPVTSIGKINKRKLSEMSAPLHS